MPLLRKIATLLEITRFDGVESACEDALGDENNNFILVASFVTSCYSIFQHFLYSSWPQVFEYPPKLCIIANSYPDQQQPILHEMLRSRN